MIEPRYKVPEVAEMIRESEDSIYRALRRGRFVGAYKAAQGGRTSPWIIPESAVKAYLRSQ
jgi:hypothetical protein